MKMLTPLNRALFGILMIVTLGIGLFSSMSVASPRVEAQKPQATPTAARRQPALASEVSKPADVHIPHHRPGHLAKTKNLNDLVVGGQNDPLAGNYTLVNWDRIATFWTDDGNKVNTKIYAENETLGNPIPKAKNAHNNMTIHAQDVTTGHLLRNDHAADTIGVGNTSDGSIWLFTSKAASDLNSYTGGANVNTGSSVLMFNTHPSPIAIATCYYCGSASGYDGIFLTFQGSDGALVLQKYDTFGESLTPVGNGNWWVVPPTNWVMNAGTLDIASGDFKGDGFPDIAVAWADPQGGTIHLRALSSVVPDRISASYTITESMIAPYVSITTGDVNGDARDEIIVVWGGTRENHTVKIGIFQVAQDLSAIKPIVITQLPDAFWLPTVAVGDFNLDGVDEIVVSGKAWSNAEVYLYILALSYDENSKQWQLTQKANLPTGSTVSNYPRLAVGDVNRDIKAEIVTTFTSGQTNNVQVFEVNAPSSGAWSITSKGKVSDERSTSDGYASVFVALGNLDAKQLRVGPPSHTLASNVLSTLAIIHMPPKHKDIVGGKTYNINPDNCALPSCTYVRYEHAETSSSQMSTTAKNTWDVSASLTGRYLLFQASIKASYGLEFEKTTTAFSSQTFGSAASANDDDVIVYSIQDIDIWEYPTYTDHSDLSQGSIIVLFPRQDANRNGTQAKIYPGTLPTSPYAPNHEPHNVLSYSMQPPNNYSETIRNDLSFAWGNADWEEWVRWENVKEHENKRASKVAVGTEGQLGNKLTPFQLNVSENYSHAHLTTNKTSFQQDVQIHIYGLAIDNKYSYDVTPWFYWSKGGTLMVDYVVSTDPKILWWKDTYNQPDPAFNLPWKDGSQGDKYRLMSREITFDPPSPQAGDNVTVTAKIRNYSPVAAQNVTVRFYLGDPDHGGPQFGPVHQISQLSGQSSFIVVEHVDTGAYANQTLNIYAKISPYTNEIHPDNNKAYALLPVKPRTGRVSPATLSVASGEITFHSTPATLGVPTHISATVRARGDTFTNLALEFWSGEPYRNGSTIIGGRLIPMVQRDGAVTDGIRWIPNGPTGQRAIWVVVRGSEQEDAYSDNQAYQILDVLSASYFFPLILN
jgi:hypothetical protein